MHESAPDDGLTQTQKLAASQACQAGPRDRAAGPPLVRSAVFVGNYRMRDEP